jgi:hypothetical protein
VTTDTATPSATQFPILFIHAKECGDMDLSEIKYQIELYTKWRDNAKTPEDKQMYTNMLRCWDNKLVKTKQEDEERREKKLQKKVEARGHTYTDWLAWAASLYPIAKEAENSFVVKSVARDWKTNRHKHVYTYETKVEALEKIDQLITTKEYDRARGHASGKDDMKS